MGLLDKLAQLGFSWPTMVAQIVNFLILLAIVYFAGYKGFLKKMLDERARKVKDSLEQADKIKTEAAQAEEELKKRLEASSKEGQEIIARAMRTGEEARLHAQEEAKQEASLLIEKAREDISRERNEVVTELRQEFADVAMTAAEKVIEKSLDKQTHQKLIDEVLEKSASLKKSA